MKVHRAVVAAALVLAASRPAAAEAPGAPRDRAAESLALGEEGLRRFRGAHWREAYDLFRQANETSHAPTLVLYMAHCQARLGDLAATYRLYRAVIRERLADDAPLQFRTAQRVAAQELRGIEARVAPVKLDVFGAPEGQLRLLVDGVEVPSAQIDDLALEPGDHAIEASIPGGATLHRTLSAAAGHPVGITLSFEAPAASATAAMVPATPTAAAPAALLPATPEPGAIARGRPPFLVGAGIAFGAGAVSFAAGAITGAISLRASTALEGRCLTGGHCLISDRASAATAGQLADASTGTLVAGALAIAAGVVLAVVHTHAPAKLSATGVRLPPGRGSVGGVF